MTRALYSTTGGGEKSALCIINSAANLGINPAFRTPPADYTDTIQFVDFPFNQDWNGTLEGYLELIDTHTPRMAIAPDIMDGGVTEGFLTYADRMNESADTVVVVPKSTHPVNVPQRFRVGIPCQDGWGSGSPWGLTEYEHTGHEVHLLGGTPNTHLEILRESEVDVRSADTACFQNGCRFNVWNGKWIAAEKAGVADYYERIRQSLNNLDRYLNRFGPRGAT